MENSWTVKGGDEGFSVKTSSWQLTMCVLQGISTWNIILDGIAFELLATLKRVFPVAVYI